MKTSELLIAARKRIETPDQWLKGYLYGTRIFHSDHVEVKPRAFPDGANCYCALGAMHVAASSMPKHPWRAAILALEHALMDMGLASSIPDYNDSHAHAEVLALFDKAIAWCLEQEAAEPA